jgi:hypothetical protein
LVDSQGAWAAERKANTYLAQAQTLASTQWARKSCENTQAGVAAAQHRDTEDFLVRNREAKQVNFQGGFGEHARKPCR